MKKSNPNAFIRAAVVGNQEQMRSLLDENAEYLSSTDADGRNALMHAVLGGHGDAVCFLLQSGCDPDGRDRLGYTALHFAAQDYLLDMVELLLEKGATVDVTDEHGNTPLFKATFYSRGRGEVIRLLINAGADQHLENHYGVSPLVLAESIANYSVLKWFNAAT